MRLKPLYSAIANRLGADSSGELPLLLAGVAAVFAVLALAGWVTPLGALMGGVSLAALIAITYGGRRAVETTERPPEDVAGESGPAETEKVGFLTASVRSAIDLFPDPVLLLDQGGNVLLSNRACRSFLGDTAAGGHISSVLRNPSVLEAVRRAVAEGTDQHVDYSQLVPVERHIRASVIPLDPAAPHEGASGRPQPRPEPLSLLLVLHDMTAVRRVEQMRVDFIANASHELRTPLASLNGFIQTLRGHARDDVAARERFLTIMEDQTERMRRLIDDLLSLSRIELNEHVVPKDDVSLISVASDVIDALAPLAAQRNQTIELTWQKGPLPAAADPAQDRVRGDHDELVQLVQNLVHNAIKYGKPNGRVRIDLGEGGAGIHTLPPGFSTGKSAPPETGGGPVSTAAFGAESNRESDVGQNGAGPASGYLYVSVSDDGIGIAREHLPRLTERFYRVDVAKSRQVGGTGLGLAIVKHIVNRHRGRLAIDSRFGEGSRFTVFLPKFAAPNGGRADGEKEATVVELKLKDTRKAAE